MSLLRYKQKLLPYGNAMGGDSGGGGGGGQPQTTTSYNTNIPEYAKPYVTNMLEATQKQLFNMDDTGITGFKPYTPYSTDVNQYFAGFSPMQQQAQRATAGLQTPGQYGTATNLAGASGLGAMGLAGQAAGVGGQYAQMAQDPMAMQGYMSPYMQNVVDYQKSQALRDFNIAKPMRSRQAVGAGAFGGSRQAIMEAEAERSLGNQLQGIAATGSQKAFEDAQRQQQFGAQLGLQGLQTGLQGLGQAGQAASTLGQLGGAQLGAQKDIIGLQSQMGKQQQELEQQKINQAIQNYAIQQQYPMMQLGFMSNMLRGLPLQSQTTQLYQAQPTTTQQAAGLIGAGASLFGGRAAGGAIKEYREGGIASVPGYKYGKLISEPKLESMADDLTISQLQQRLKDPALTPGERQVFAEALQEKMQQEKSRMSGIAMAGGPAFESQGMAGGGILAFSNGGMGMLDPEFGGGDQSIDVRKPMTVEELFKEYPGLEGKVGLSQIQDYTSGRSAPPESARAKPAPVAAPVAAAPKSETKAPVVKGEGTGTEKKSDRSVVTTGPKTLADFFNQQKELNPKGQVGEGFEKFIDEYTGDKDRLSRKERLAMAKGFLKFGSTAGPIGKAAIEGFGEYATGAEAARDAEDKIKFETAKIKGDLDKARRAEQRGDVEGAQKAFDSAANRDNQIKVAQMQLARSSEFERQYEAFKNNPAQFEKFRKSLTSQDDTARLNAYVKADTFVAQNYPQLQFSKKPEDIAKLDQIRKDKITQYLGALGISEAPMAAAPAAPQMGTDGTVTIPGMGKFKQLPNGNYVKV